MAPARAESHEGLPPAVVVTAGFDVLQSEGASYAQRLRAANVPVVHRDYPGLFHGFLTIMPFAAGAAARELLWADMRRLLPVGRRRRRDGRRDRDRRRVRRAVRGAPLPVGRPDGAGHRGRAERRRHLVLEPLSRCALRRRKRRLLLLFRRRPAERLDVDGAVRGAARDPGVPGPCRRPVRSAASLPVRHRGGRRAVRRSGRRVGGADVGGREPPRPVPVVRDGLPVGGEPARHPRARRLRGRGRTSPRRGRATIRTCAARRSA